MRKSVPDSDGADQKFPKVEMHEKEFYTDVLEKIGCEKFGDKIVDWFINGDFESRLLLTNGFMKSKKFVNKDLALRAFSMELDGMRFDKSLSWLMKEIPEKIDEFLVDATDTEGKVEMFFKILSAKEKYIEENGSDSVFRSRGSYREPETWDDHPIVKHLVLKLQERRDEAIKIL